MTWTFILIHIGSVSCICSLGELHPRGAHQRTAFPCSADHVLGTNVHQNGNSGRSSEFWKHLVPKLYTEYKNDDSKVYKCAWRSRTQPYSMLCTTHRGMRVEFSTRNLCSPHSCSPNIQCTSSHPSLLTWAQPWPLFIRWVLNDVCIYWIDWILNRFYFIDLNVAQTSRLNNFHAV